MSSNSLIIDYLRLIRLQIAYAIAGCLFNMISLIQIILGQPGLTNTSPIAGLIVMAIVWLAAMAGLKGYKRVSLAINLLLIGPLLYSGIFGHLGMILSDHTGPLFQPPIVIAIAINSFGVAVITLLIIRFTKPK